MHVCVTPLELALPQKLLDVAVTLRDVAAVAAVLTLVAQVLLETALVEPFQQLMAAYSVPDLAALPTCRFAQIARARSVAAGSRAVRRVATNANSTTAVPRWLRQIWPVKTGRRAFGIQVIIRRVSPCCRRAAEARERPTTRNSFQNSTLH
jgi:hypothetical protein